MGCYRECLAPAPGGLIRLRGRAQHTGAGCAQLVQLCGAAAAAGGCVLRLGQPRAQGLCLTLPAALACRPPCRVNSSEMAAAAEAAGTPLSSGRAALQHHSLFSSSHGPVSPRDGFAVELTAVLNGGAGGGRGSGAGTPQHAAEQQQLLPKKHTPGPPVESVQLLERLPPEVGGSSTAAAAGPSRAHLRSSYTGSGGGGPGGSGTAPSSVSPLGLVAAARSRLSSLTAV